MTGTSEQRPVLCDRHAGQVWGYLWLAGPGDHRTTDAAVRFALRTLDDRPCTGVGHTVCQAPSILTTGDHDGGGVA